jgi:uncharacterized protein with PIN domain
MKLTTDLLKKMIRMVKMTRPDEIGCDECFEKLHEFAEMKLEGKSPEEAMPLVEDHLNRCNECKEEFEVLLEVLKGQRASA